jgi:light-regulated signal transduction histidine kinase (bacteriophytochrome)
LTGLKKSDVIGKTHREVVPEDASFIKIYGEVARTGLPVHFDRWSPALRRHYDVYVYSPAPGQVALLFLDITERKKAEHAQRESEERLRQANAELEAVNKELEAFSYAVASDLKTPLRSIEGFSRALLEDYAGLLDDTGKDYCRRIQASTLRMTQLIEALWTMSRLTGGEPAEHVIDLSAEAQVIARELQKRQPERRIDFIIAEGVKVKGDTDMMRVVLENLLDNAWKFTARHATAKIEFGAKEHDRTRAYYVRDDGAGFDMAFADRLFRPFQRLHTDSEFPGIGIGLAIAHNIIKRHGGRMWAEAGVEKGATFYFTL